MADISKIVLPDGTTCNLVSEVANKLGTSNVGAYNKPIYLNAGVPTQCSQFSGTGVHVKGENAVLTAVELLPSYENNSGTIYVNCENGEIIHLSYSGGGGCIILGYPTATTASKNRVQISAMSDNGAIYLMNSNADNTISLYGDGGSITSTTQTLNGGDLLLNTSGSSSNDSSDIVWKYGNGQEKARLWTDDTYSSAKGLNYRVYKSDGTQLATGTIPLSDTNTTYTVATGDSNGQIKVTPSSGSAYNVGVKGWVNASTSNTANYLVQRDGNGDTRQRYAYVTHINQSSGDQTTTCAGQDGYVIYANSDGWLRKAKAVTSLYSGTYTSSGTITCSGAYKRYNYYVVQGQITGNDRNGQQSCVIPSNWLTTSDQKFEMANEDGWYSFKIKYSGTNVIINFLNRASSAGCINRVWGII